MVTSVWRRLSRTCFSFVSCREEQGTGQHAAAPKRGPDPQEGAGLTSSSPREVTTASIIFRGLFTLDTVSFPSEPSNCTAGAGGTWGGQHAARPPRRAGGAPGRER